MISDDELKFLRSRLQELRKRHRKTKDRRVAYRLNALILIALGWEYPKIAEALMLDERTIARLKATYLVGGLAALEKSNYEGSESDLNAAQKNLLIQHVETNLCATSKEVCHFVKKTFSIAYTPNGMTHLLKRLGFVHKQTKLVPGKDDPKEQKRFVAAYKRFRKHVKTRETVYFMDACHPTHNVLPGRAWIRRGEERGIKSNSGRDRVNLIGAWNPITRSFVGMDTDSVDSLSIIQILKVIEARHKEMNCIKVFVDNARVHFSEPVMEYLKTSKVVLVPLPTYSPNLNLVERIWGFFKKKILYNHYYPTFDKFRKVCLDFMKNLEYEFKNELRTLMTENFHLFPKLS